MKIIEWWNAISSCDLLSVRALLKESNTYLTLTNRAGENALIFSSGPPRRNNLIPILIAEGSNIHERNFQGLTALMCAAHANNKEAVEMLLKAGADINEKDAYGNTPLMRAIVMNAENVAHTLLQSGADIHIQNDEGWNALMCACNRNCLVFANVLLCAGTDETIKNKWGWSALRYASHKGCADILKLFSNTPADVNDLFESHDHLQQILNEKEIQLMIESRMNELSLENLALWKKSRLQTIFH